MLTPDIKLVACAATVESNSKPRARSEFVPCSSRQFHSRNCVQIETAKLRRMCRFRSNGANNLSAYSTEARTSRHTDLIAGIGSRPCARMQAMTGCSSDEMQRRSPKIRPWALPDIWKQITQENWPAATVGQLWSPGSVPWHWRASSGSKPSWRLGPVHFTRRRAPATPPLPR